MQDLTQAAGDSLAVIARALAATQDTLANLRVDRVMQLALGIGIFALVVTLFLGASTIIWMVGRRKGA